MSFDIKYLFELNLSFEWGFYDCFANYKFMTGITGFLRPPPGVTKASGVMTYSYRNKKNVSLSVGI